MRSRTVVLTFEIPTDLPVKVLREAWISVPPNGHCLHPVNKPRVEVIQTAKAKGKRR